MELFLCYNKWVVKSKLITKADIVLAVVLLVLGLSSPFLIQKKGSAQSQVVISIDGEEKGRYDLSESVSLGVLKAEDGSYDLIDIIYLNALHPDDFWDNLIIIENGKVSVTHASCKGNDCVQTGKISKEGQIIACLPHKLLITIEGRSDAPDVVLK